MNLRNWKWLLTWEGRVTRMEYFLAGSILSLIKFAIDHAVAAHFGEPWQIWNYVIASEHVSLFGLGARKPELYAILWAIAIPFFGVGIALTLRRLRDTGHSTGWVFLFFVPVGNLLLFLFLILAPGTLAPGTRKTMAEAAAFDELQRTKSGRTAVPGVAVAVALGFGLVVWGSQVLLLYGWGMFLGIPFITGFVSSWFLNLKRVRSRLDAVAVSILTPCLIGAALLGFRKEGLGCLVMAIPLALPFSIAGGLVARSILLRRRILSTPPGFAACVAMLPLLMVFEHGVNVAPPVIAVTTSVTIEAPATVVWKKVVAFTPLDPPEEWLFRAGIAYPTSARLVGSGPGAVRYCRFSTGDFVEPITVWDENRLLAFDVAAQPPAMLELSPWKINPPHVERNYLRSLHGQFRLVALSDHRTLLEGTTWYQNYLWPQVYWREWSDAILHRIHERVLRHVKEDAEGAMKQGGSGF